MRDEGSHKIRENLFDALIENSPDAIAISDINGTIIECSESFIKLFGYDSKDCDELTGKDGFSLINDVDRKKSEEAFEQLLKDGFLNDREGIFYRKDGTEFIGSLNMSLVYDADKNPLYIIGVVRDITKHKELEKASIEKDRLLKQSEERFRNIIDSIVNIIVEIDINGIITYISPQVYETLGFSPEELLGRIVFNFVHAEDLDGLNISLQKAISSKKPIIYEFRGKHKNGHYIPLLSYGNITEVNGDLRIIGSLADITDKKENELRIRASEEKYRRLYETAQVGFWTSRLKDDVIINGNDKMASIVGLTKANDVIGTRLIDYIKKDYLSKLNDLLIEFGIVSNFEAELIIPSGVEKAVSITARLFQEKNKEDFIEGFMIDITNLKKIQDALKESEEMFQLVLNNIPQFIFWKDIDSRYMGCNENFARVAGVKSPDEIKGKTDKDLAWQKEEAEFFHETDALVMESNTPEYHITEQQLQADGKHAWLDTNKIPLHNSEGNVVGLLGTYEDITERVNAEIALKKSEVQYREAFQNANLLKDLFSHDINNILQSIQTANEIYDLEVEKGNYDKLEEITDIIRMQINRGAKLVNNVRKLTLLDNTEVKLESVNVIKYLEDSINAIKNIFPNKNILVQKKIAGNNMKIQANEFLCDIFENILLNAVMYNDNSIIKVKINISREKSKDQKFIRISIQDNGIGIEDIRKESIFERIYNKDKTISGVGLGLSLVKKIVESYNGKIWIEDVLQGDPSKGSNFIILIPEAFITMKF